MRTKAPFDPNQRAGKNFDVAVYGKYANNPLAGPVFSEVATWPKNNGDVNFGRIEDARVFTLLSVLVPALCQRNSEPFRLFADAIDAMNAGAYPEKRLQFFISVEAARIVGHRKALPIGRSEFKRSVERRSGIITDNGHFYRVCAELGFTFHKDPKRGGRPKTTGGKGFDRLRQKSK